MKMCFTKNCLKRALRTFLQTALGYILANLALFLTGTDFANAEMWKSAVCGLLVSSVSAGLSAVMNLEKRKNRQSVTINAHKMKKTNEYNFTKINNNIVSRRSARPAVIVLC